MARHLCVRYVYREAPANRAEPISLRGLEALAALPEELRKELGEALVYLYAQPIEAVIARVAKQDPQLGEVLSRCARRFAYTEILKALEECKPRAPNGG
jgi:hypothetical protein